MKQTLILLTLLAVLSCSSKVQEVEVIQLTEAIRTDAIPLKAELIELRDTNIYAYRHFVYNDSLLIIVNESGGNKKAIELYEFPSQKFIRDIFPYGRGPGEIIGPSPRLKRDKLMVKDVTLRRFYFMPFDSLTNPTYEPITHEMGFPVYGANEYNENQMIAENFYCYENEELGISNNASRFVVFDKDADKNRIEIYGEHKYDTYNVAGANIEVNKSKNSVVLSFMKNNFIEFYDYDLNLIKKYIAPDETNVKHVISSSDGAVVFGSLPFNGFVYTYSTDDYVYFTYNGGHSFSAKADADTWILKFDWIGNFINSYYYDRNIRNLTVGGNDTVFYGNTQDEDGNLQLAKFTY